MHNVIRQALGEWFALYQGDSAEVIKGLPDASVGLSVFSPPFASLFTYSASERDMGNCRNHSEFHEHMAFLMPELLRVTKPGRVCCVHCMDLATVKSRDGYIGLIDFPGELIRGAVAAGWYYHGRITIRKDPVVQMQRTKALPLLFKQIQKDSAMNRPGIADYVIALRKPGDNPEPVVHRDVERDGLALKNKSREELMRAVGVWQDLAEPVWTDIDQGDTLQYRSAREHEDERHICPLQLEVIRRCVRLWSNPGDVVLSPFAGIGSEGHVALTEGRRFVGIELKGSYYEQAERNLRAAEPNGLGRQVDLFA